MRYLTKEWYEMNGKTGLHLLLNVSEQASEFSESFFEKTYSHQEQEWMKMQRAVYDCLKKYQKRPFFDLAKARKRFREKYLWNLRQFQEKLPRDILEQVADIRVLALGYAEEHVKNQITAFCENHEKTVDSIYLAYRESQKRELEKKTPAFAENFSFHDFNISSCYKDGADFIITIDEPDFTSIKKILLLDCHIIKQDAALEKTTILYEEFYIENDRYEIHFLLAKYNPLLREDELIDFIASVSDVEYEVW